MKKLKTNFLTDGNASLLEVEEGGYFVTFHTDSFAAVRRAEATFSFAFQKGDKLFLNGYQSWTYSPEWESDGVDNSMRFCPAFLNEKFGFSAYGDGNFYKKSYQKGILHGYSYAYVRRGEKYFLIGSLNEDSAFLRVIFNTVQNTITFESDCGGRAFEGDFCALAVKWYEGSENEVFSAWFADLKITPPAVKKKTGYTSWYNYYQNISEEILLNDLEGFSSLPKRPDIFQIDDGYESKVGDWLSIDPLKFPNGLAPVAERIRSIGCRAGIWLAPFVCEKDSEVYKTHPDWLKRDGTGKTVYGGGNWSGMYALDLDNGEVREYIRKSIGYYKEMGFSLFKLDFLYAACMIPDKDHTRAERMAEAMKFLREVCGDAEILGCGVPLASAFGRVEYCRVGMDMSLKYDDEWFMRLFHSERPSTKHTMRNTVYRRQLGGRAFLCDPDVFLLREDNMHLTREQRRSLAVINALFGGVLFASDNFGRYDEKKRVFYSYLVSLQNATLLSVKEERGTLTVKFLLDGKNRTEVLYFA